MPKITSLEKNITMKNFIFSLFLFFIFACSPNLEKKYASKKGPWEKEVSKLIKEDPGPNPNAILFTGSSSIRLWNSIKEDMAPYQVIKKGYGGAHYSDFIHFTKDLIYPSQAKAICIFIANDITGDKQDITPKETLNLAKYTLNQIRQKYPDTPVFLIGITPNNSRWQVWDKQKEINALFSNFAAKTDKLFYIDTEKAFLNKKGIPNDGLFMADRLHLNREGYAIWASIIKDNLNKNL